MKEKLIILAMLMFLFAAVLSCQSSSSLTWQRMYGGSGEDWVYSIQLMPDGGYVAAGISLSTGKGGVEGYGDMDIYILRLDDHGNVVWENMYGGSGGDRAYSIELMPDEGFVAAGISSSTDIAGVENHGESDIYILRLDKNGNLTP
jgi:hypothetical protein